MGENNDLFVLDMGESIKIYDLAKLLITLHGYEPEKDIKIKMVGLRPGEKLYEEVLVDQEQTESTKTEKIFKTKNYLNFDKTAFLYNLISLRESLDSKDLNNLEVKSILQMMVSTYVPSKEEVACPVDEEE
jgi:FlaA1/EpsC-like NDP-sugar epimerase